MPQFLDFLTGFFSYLKDHNKKSFFYTNDLNIFIDTVIREVRNTSNGKLRERYLVLMYKLVITKEYK